MKNIIGVTKMGLSENSHAYPIPEIWYQMPCTRGMLYIMEDIKQLNFKTDLLNGPELIRVETTNAIYVKV